jgi:hypothetical protein
MTVYNTFQDADSLPLPYPASLAISIGDLLYWDTSALCVRPMNYYTTSGTEATDQAAIAPLFIGASQDARLVTETTAGIRVVRTKGIFDASVVNSYTPALGDLVAVTYGNSGTTLQNQMVKKTSTAADAIGRVIGIPTQTGNAQSWGTSSLTVRVLLKGYLTQY